MEPLTQWWNFEDDVCVALRSVNLTPVVTVGGALDLRAVQPCRMALEAALRKRPRTLLIDLTSVTSTEASGAGVLTAMRRTATWHGADVWLAAVPDMVRSELDRSGVSAQFPMARNALRAIEEIRRQAPPRTLGIQVRPARPNPGLDTRTA